MNKHERLLEELAIAMHSNLAIGHTIAAFYHLRRADRKWVHFGAHALGAVYSGLSVLHHLKALKGVEDDE